MHLLQTARFVLLLTASTVLVEGFNFDYATGSGSPWFGSSGIGSGLDSVNGGNNIEPECRYNRTNNEPIEFELERLYNLALKESRSFTSLEGGDEMDDMADVAAAFRAKFRCITPNLVVDLSKYHDVRIDRELRSGKMLTFDIAHLQTVHDFYRWKDEGCLLQFSPLGSEWVFKDVKDPDGYFHALNLITFSHYTRKSVQNKPTRFTDYLNPRWKGGGQIVLTYPHDDDAVLYQFYLALKIDPQFVEKLVAQEPRWVRGTGTPAILIDRNDGNAAVTFSVAHLFNNTQNPTGEFTIPTPREPFLTWGQLAAIFKNAPNPNTAKLYLTWWLSKPQQNAWIQWSSRWDLNDQANKGIRLYDYPNTDAKDFVNFMRNRPLVNELIAYMNQVIGPVTGVSPLTDNIRN